MSSASIALAPGRPAPRKHLPSGIRFRTGRKPYATVAARRADRAAWATRAFLFAATALYLCIELPFATALVELLSGRADHHAVEQAERVGRFVSGAALALALWGRYLPRWISKRTSLAAVSARLALLTVICVALMMIGQRTIVDRIADAAPDAWRRAALQGAVLRDAAAASVSGDPAVQALTGTLPFLGMLDRAAYDALPGRVAAVRAYAERSFPSASAYRDEVAAPALAKLRDAYRDYASASDRIAEGRRQAAPRLERSWADLQDAIARRRLDVNDPSVRRSIVRTVNERGIYVPLNWHPYDRATFFRSGMDSAVGSAERSLRSALDKAFGDASIPFGIDGLDAFAAQPAVRASLRKSLGLAEAGPALRPGAGAGAVADRHFAEARKRFSDRFVAAVDASGPLAPDLHGRGGDAVRLAVAAAFGVVLSAIGAAVHLCKLAYYGGSLAPRAVGARAALVASGVAAALLVALPLAQDTVRQAVPAPLAWASGVHGLVGPAGHALAGSPALAATEALVGSLPSR